MCHRSKYEKHSLLEGKTLEDIGVVKYFMNKIPVAEALRGFLGPHTIWKVEFRALAFLAFLGPCQLPFLSATYTHIQCS